MPDPKRTEVEPTRPAPVAPVRPPAEAPRPAADKPAQPQPMPFANEPAPPSEPQYVDPANPGAGVRVPKGKRARRMSETIEGGRYVVDAVFDEETGDVKRGRVVNANGDLIEEIGAEAEA